VLAGLVKALQQRAQRPSEGVEEGETDGCGLCQRKTDGGGGIEGIGIATQQGEGLWLLFRLISRGDGCG